MQCALCLTDAELKRSHIIPAFLYESLYDDKHRLQVLSVIPDQDNWREQKGLRERLLCGICEQRFSILERYASLALKGGLPMNYRQERNIVFVSGMDYSKFKLFQLSVLWRAGVSTLAFFEKVDLGRHQETLRQLLLMGDPGSPDQYGCLMYGLKLEGKTMTGLIMQPGKVRLNGHTAYRFVFGGFLWAMFVSSHSLGSLNACTLRQNGDTAIMVRDAAEMDNLASFTRELSELGRAPKREA